MLQKTLGCRELCPLCRKQCDQVHDDDILENQIHSCDSGHQIQGFGGNMHAKLNNAITFGCYDPDNNDIVFWKGTEMKWEKFKTHIYNELHWDIENKEGAKELIKLKNVKIWNKIGPFICEYYKAIQSIEIKFQKADASANNKRKIEKAHYILMLDNSGSMSEKEKNGQSRWQNLFSAVTSFIAKFDAAL